MKINTQDRISAVSLLFFVSLALSSIGLDVVADEDTNFSKAIKNGTAHLSFRYRFESVEQDNSLKDASASTLKTRLNFTTQASNGLQAFIEVDDVSVIGADSYNDTHFHNTQYSVVADPEGTDINQVWLRFSGLEKNIITLGRQRMNFDNQRFFGGVGWRQNEQTYDALMLTNTSFTNISARYVYMYNVNRIFGPGDGAQLADFGTDSHLINVSFEGWNVGKLNLYAYLMDVEDAHAFATETYGARFNAKYKLSEKNKLLFTAELATQTDYGGYSDQTNFDANYYTLSGSFKSNAFTSTLGYEVLEGNSTSGGESFRTPFATLHKFNGWADQFLGTPAAGLEDIYVNVSSKLGGFKVMLVYHDFSSEDGSDNYGSEVDISLSRSLSKKASVLLKYADYSADDEANSVLGKVDTQKIWLMLTMKF